MVKKRLSKFYRNRNILIPGGAGFVGSNLAKELVNCGAMVTIVDSFSEFCGANSFNLEEIKNKVILARERIEDFITEKDLTDYDIIFNCVGLTNHHIGFNESGLDYEINCQSGLKMLQSLKNKKAKCKMVSFGSRNQYGKADSGLIDEAQLLYPLDIQAIHKTALEYYHNIYAINYGLDLIFLRSTNIYGPGQRLRGEGIGIIGEIIKSSIIGNDVIIYGSLERTKDILYVADVTDALLLLGMSDRDSFRVYNLGGGRCKISDLISSIKKKIKNVRVKVLPFPDKLNYLDTGSATMDIKKLKRDTGWKPEIAIDEGIGITLDYYKRYKKDYL